MTAAAVGAARNPLLTRSVLTVAPRQIGLVLRDSREPGGPETVVPVVAANEALPVCDRRISAATLAPDQGRAMVTLVEQLGPVVQPEREFHRDVAVLEISGLKGARGGELVGEPLVGVIEEQRAGHAQDPPLPVGDAGSPRRRDPGDADVGAHRMTSRGSILRPSGRAWVSTPAPWKASTS